MALATSLPREHYVSDEWFARDMEHVFGRRWVYGGHVSEVPAPGDFLVREIGDESVIVVRSETGALHAIFNVCRHRGARFCQEEKGSVGRFICPYHQWTYALDGQLLKAPNFEALDTSDWPLHRAHVEEWNGLVFVNIGEEAPEPVASIMHGAVADIAPFAIGECRIAHEVVYEVPANWKLVLENFFECYHCPSCHPEFMQAVDVADLFASEYGSISDGVDHPYATYGRLPLRPSAKSLSVSGNYVSTKLIGDFAEGLASYVAGACLRPTTSVVACADYVRIIDFQPTAPMHTRVRCQWLVAHDAIEDEHFRVAELIEVWDATNRQDWYLCEITQQGVRSSRYVPGPHNPSREPGVERFLESYFKMLEDDA
jgi:Rieske 2Fe-2S family protein